MNVFIVKHERTEVKRKQRESDGGDGESRVIVQKVTCLTQLQPLNENLKDLLSIQLGLV